MTRIIVFWGLYWVPYFWETTILEGTGDCCREVPHVVDTNVCSHAALEACAQGFSVLRGT